MPVLQRLAQASRNGSYFLKQFYAAKDVVIPQPREESEANRPSQLIGKVLGTITA